MKIYAVEETIDLGSHVRGLFLKKSEAIDYIVFLKNESYNKCPENNKDYWNVWCAHTYRGCEYEVDKREDGKKFFVDMFGKEV